MVRSIAVPGMSIVAALLVTSAALSQCGTPPGYNDPSPSIEEFKEWCSHYGRVQGSGSDIRCNIDPNWCGSSTASSGDPLSATARQLGQAVGKWLGEFIFGKPKTAAQKEQERRQREQAAAEAAAEAAAREARKREEAEARRQALLAEAARKREEAEAQRVAFDAERDKSAKTLEDVRAVPSGGNGSARGTVDELEEVSAADRNPSARAAGDKSEELSPAPPKSSVTVSSALEQLSSASKSGEAARKAPTLEGAHEEAACVFDTNPCAEPDHTPGFKRSSGGSPLDGHIPPDPKAQNDEAIRTSRAWYESLEGHKEDAQAALAEVNRQIKSGTGDATVLKARAGTLANELRQFQQDQQKAMEQVKKRLLDLGTPWIEEPPAAKSNAKP